MNQKGEQARHGVHAFDHTLRGRWRKIFEFKTSLIYIMGSRIASFIEKCCLKKRQYMNPLNEILTITIILYALQMQSYIYLNTQKT